MKTYLFGFAALILLVSCEKEEANLASSIRVDIDLITKLNAKSNDTLIIGDKAFVLDAYLYRDFMPISPPDGNPMISINWLVSIDSTEIPNNFDLIKQYVIYNDSIWISDYTNETLSSQPNFKVKRISREGPKWGPKIHVDVISNVYDAQQRKDFYIRTKNVYVGRTD